MLRNLTRCSIGRHTWNSKTYHCAFEKKKEKNIYILVLFLHLLAILDDNAQQRNMNFWYLQTAKEMASLVTGFRLCNVRARRFSPTSVHPNFAGLRNRGNKVHTLHSRDRPPSVERDPAPSPRASSCKRTPIAAAGRARGPRTTTTTNRTTEQAQRQTDRAVHFSPPRSAGRAQLEHASGTSLRAAGSSEERRAPSGRRRKKTRCRLCPVRKDEISLDPAPPAGTRWLARSKASPAGVRPRALQAPLSNTLQSLSVPTECDGGVAVPRSPRSRQRVGSSVSPADQSALDWSGGRPIGRSQRVQGVRWWFCSTVRLEVNSRARLGAGSCRRACSRCLVRVARK